MNILSESLLSNTEEQCHNCEQIGKEFAVLKRKLALSYSSISWLENLETIHSELQSIQSIAKENNVSLEGLAAGLNYSLDKIFSCKTKEMVDKGKKVVDLIFELFNKISENAALQKEKSIRKEQLPKRSESEVEERTQKKDNNGRYETKRPPFKQQQEGKTQKFEELHDYSSSNRDKQQESKSEKESFSILQSSHNEQPQHRNKQNQSYSYDDICLPLIWEETSSFKAIGKTITKLHDNDYKKICTEMPLPRTGIHKLKFQMVNAGTVAFGVVPEGLKYGRFFDNKKAIKYLTFQNGGGLVKECDDKMIEGKKVHIAEGEVLEIVYRAEQRELVYRNSKLGEIVVEISKHPIFKNKEVYFFLQMKQENTKIKIL